MDDPRPYRPKHAAIPPESRRRLTLARMADEPDSTDVLGSYTGTAANGDEPTQDADDL